MKKCFAIVFVLLPTILFISCRDEIDGIWDDHIKFSTTKIDFSFDDNTKIITSVGTFWWIQSHIQINGKNIPLIEGENNLKITKGKMYNLNPDVIYDEGADLEYKKIESDWFTITKTDASKIEIKVNKNNTGNRREITIPIQGGNYFTAIHITQNVMPE